MKKGDKGKKVFGAIVILAIITSVFGGVVSAEDVSGGLKQSVDDAEIETAIGNLSSEELAEAFDAVTDDIVNIEFADQSAGVGVVSNRTCPRCKQCGDQTDDCPCGMPNPYPCCDNNCDGDSTDVCDGNCCWWAWDRACCNWGVGLPNWGWAKDWANNAGLAGYPVSSTPAVNTIACNSGLGHVAWVTGVNADKSEVTVSEMNCWNPYGGHCDQCSGQASTVCTNIGHSYRICTRSSSWFDGGYIYPKDGAVTLTLYVHEDSASGPVLSGARVTGQDAAGTSFDKTTGSGGYVTITGAPGTWQFRISKSGYKPVEWDLDITTTCERHAYFSEFEDVTLTLYVHDGSWKGSIVR